MDFLAKNQTKLCQINAEPRGRRGARHCRPDSAVRGTRPGAAIEPVRCGQLGANHLRLWDDEKTAAQAVRNRRHFDLYLYLWEKAARKYVPFLEGILST